ncbi:MAG: isochorismatase family protein, partial [Proteobacteria bacterium]|nr:isochorismatase family protein [Pseudomonadota bacterium]
DQFGGGNISEACDNTVKLIEACRSLGLPIAHTRIVFSDDGSDDNVFSRKVPPLQNLLEDSHASQIVERLAPRRGEIVVRKRLPSAFFGTDLAPNLTLRGVDTVLIAGCVTSGCIHASVLDVMCHGFCPILISDCVGDRDLDAHETNLRVLGQIYADVIPRDEAIAELTSGQAQAAE